MKRLVTIAAIAVSAFCFGQFFAGFENQEGYVGSPDGTLLEGQKGWYNPSQESAPGLVFNYTNNALGIAKNPSMLVGGARFFATVTNSAAGEVVSRVQRDIPFGPGLWHATYDFCPIYNGLTPGEDTLGSFSLQPSETANNFQTLCRWPDPADPTMFSMLFGVSDATGLPGGTPISMFRSAGQAWSNLPVNHWYRSSIIWDFASNRIISVSIQDLTTGGPRTFFTPLDWYLSGGSSNVRARTSPTAVRFFSGGTSTGNAVGYDNVIISPTSPTETLAPVSEQVVLGTTNRGGNLDSWAADDHNARTICRFFAPPDNSVTRVRLAYITPKTFASEISVNVKVATHSPNNQRLTVRVENVITNLFIDTDVSNATIINGKTYHCIPRGDLSNYIRPNGEMRVEVATFRTSGMQSASFPCITYEFAQVEITGE